MVWSVGVWIKQFYMVRFLERTKFFFAGRSRQQKTHYYPAAKKIDNILPTGHLPLSNSRLQSCIIWHPLNPYNSVNFRVRGLILFFLNSAHKTHLENVILKKFQLVPINCNSAKYSMFWFDSITLVFNILYSNIHVVFSTLFDWINFFTF